MKTIFQRTALGFAVFALVGNAQAQTASSSASAALTEVVITGNPLGRDQLAQPVSQLSARDLREQDQGTLGETLNALPGVGSTYLAPKRADPPSAAWTVTVFGC